MWSVLTGWVFVGALFALLVGAGFSVMSMTPPQYTLAEAFFTIAAIVLLGRTAWWVAFEHRPTASVGLPVLFCFVVFGSIGALWYTGMRWIESLRPHSQGALVSPPPPFNITRSISLENLIVIPSAADERFTVVRMQLLPPLEDQYPDRHIINAVLLSFENGGQPIDRNVSLKVYLPGVREVVCTSDRIHVVEGNLGATFVNLLVPELNPGEKFSCRVDLTQIVSDIRTVTEWKKRYGPVMAWSERRAQFEVFVYRVSLGPEMPTPPGAIKPLVRKVTIHPK